MWFSATVDVVAINRSVRDLSGVVQPKLGVSYSVSKQVVLHRQVDTSAPCLRLNGGKDSFEYRDSA